LNHKKSSTNFGTISGQYPEAFRGQDTSFFPAIAVQKMGAVNLPKQEYSKNR
jgi:hypothetical protein